MSDKPNLICLVECVEHFSRSLVEADGQSFSDQVHLANHIFEHLHWIEAEIEKLLKGKPREAREEAEVEPDTNLRLFDPAAEGVRVALPIVSPQSQNGHTEKLDDRHLPKFRNKTLVQAGAILLTDEPVLHGKELERLMKERGYRSNAVHFQKMLEATFKRDGRFENVGGNRWRLRQAPHGRNGDGGRREEEKRPESEN